MQLTRAFTQLRDELGDAAALEVVSEVYDEVSPPRHADSRRRQEQEQEQQEQQEQQDHVDEGREEQKRTRTLTTPEQPPYETSEDGKEVLF